METKPVQRFPASQPADESLDSVAIWKKGEQFVVVAMPPKKKGRKKPTAPWIVFELESRIYKEKEGIYTSVCPALEVASQGDDEKEARKNIHEAVGLFLEDCAEAGTLERVLLKRGFEEMHKRRAAIQGEAIRGVTAAWIPASAPAGLHKKNGRTEGSWGKFIPVTS